MKQYSKDDTHLDLNELCLIQRKYKGNMVDLRLL